MFLAEPVVQGLDVDRPLHCVAQDGLLLAVDPVVDYLGQQVGLAGFIGATVGIVPTTQVVTDTALGHTEGLGDP